MADAKRQYLSKAEKEAKRRANSESQKSRKASQRSSYRNHWKKGGKASGSKDKKGPKGHFEITLVTADGGYTKMKVSGPPEGKRLYEQFGKPAEKIRLNQRVAEFANQVPNLYKEWNAAKEAWLKTNMGPAKDDALAKMNAVELRYNLAAAKQKELFEFYELGPVPKVA
jgi:hypothetical protein